MNQPMSMVLTGVDITALGIVQDQSGRPAIINLRGLTTMRSQAIRREAAAWSTTSAAVIAIVYRLDPKLPWIEADTAQRISAAGILPATGVGYDVTGYAEAALKIITAGPTGATADLALYAEDAL